MKLTRKRRIRAKVWGTNVRPRLSVFRSSRHIYAQIIDDSKGVTIVSYSDLAIPKEKKVGKTEAARIVGKALAGLAKERKIDKVVFDRGGNKFHGRVKSVADGAREGGLNF